MDEVSRKVERERKVLQPRERDDGDVNIVAGDQRLYVAHGLRRVHNADRWRVGQQCDQASAFDSRFGRDSDADR